MPAAGLPRRRTYNITSSSLARQHAQDSILYLLPSLHKPRCKATSGPKAGLQDKRTTLRMYAPILQSPPANLPAFVFHYLFFAKNSNQNIGRMEENG